MSLFLTFSSGCIVLDEMDAAAAKMPVVAKKKQDPAEERSMTAPGVLSKNNPLIKQSKQWWKSATSLAPTGIDSSIVSCRLSQGTQFMSKDDCLGRGGKPQGVSG